MKFLVVPALLLVAAASQAQLMSLSEGFEDATTLPAAGWSQQNLSSPVGVSTYVQGSGTLGPAQAGTTNSYLLCNFNSTTGTGTISNWLFTPVLQLGGTFSFYTRAAGTFPDRLELRQSSNGASVNAGTTATSVGDFSSLLVSVNPNLTVTGYPAGWTQYTVQTTGTGTGRLAFRYFVTNGGPDGANSNIIGLDTVSYTASAVPEPATMATLGLGAVALIKRRRKSA